MSLGYLERERETERGKGGRETERERDRERGKNSENLEKFSPLESRKDLYYIAANSEALPGILSDTEHYYSMHYHSIFTKK